MTVMEITSKTSLILSIIHMSFRKFRLLNGVLLDRGLILFLILKYEGRFGQKLDRIFFKGITCTVYLIYGMSGL